MLLNRFPDSQLGDLTNLRVKQKCFWASQYFATCILPIFTCPTLFIFVPLELCNLKSSLHSLDTGGPLAIPGQLWSTPCPSQQRCTSGASPASVVTARQQYQQIRLRTADWHRQRLTNRIQSDCKVVPFKLTRLSMTFYDFLPVMCINSPVPSLSPAQARRSRTVCQCYGKDLPAVSCVHCVHLFQFSEFPDCLDSMHVHLCVAICCNMLEYVAFSCVFPFQHSLPVQKKNKHGQLPKRCFASLILSRELQLGPGQGQLGALYKLPQRLELDHEAQCPAKWNISQEFSNSQSFSNTNISKC